MILLYKKLLDKIKNLKHFTSTHTFTTRSQIDQYNEDLVELKGIKETVETNKELIDIVETVLVATTETEKINALFELKKIYVKTLTTRQQIEQELNIK